MEWRAFFAFLEALTQLPILLQVGVLSATSIHLSAATT